jgi:NADH-quinone oxidoreductase subunit L
MVAAGIYLVARTLPLFTPESLLIVLVIGLATHLFAGTVALTMTDIKRVLAYSTISQLGFMMTALGLGARELAMFHLLTHAFFKALLFLGAGSVIHAIHRQDLAQLGGLFRVMPWTATTFLIAALSMSGAWPLSGFWSKEAILAAAHHEHPWMMWALLGGAVMTASYVFRVYLRCFHGQAATPAESRFHESSRIMVMPMAALALGAAGAGLPWLHQPLLRLLGKPTTHEDVELAIFLWSTGALVIGVLLAWLVGFQRRSLVPGWLRPVGTRLYRVVAHAYYVDGAYDRFIVQPFLLMTRALSRFDLRVIDGLVDQAGVAGWSLSQLKDQFDRQVVDRLVNGLAQAVRAVSQLGRRLQTGLVHHYLLVVASAVVVLAMWLQ